MSDLCAFGPGAVPGGVCREPARWLFRGGSTSPIAVAVARNLCDSHAERVRSRGLWKLNEPNGPVLRPLADAPPRQMALELEATGE